MQPRPDESLSTGAPNGAAGDARLRAHALRGIRRDLDQLGSLLGDAVGRLTDSFDTLATTGEAQHRLLVAAAVRPGTTAHADVDALHGTFESGIASTVTALQFHDIASQILAQLAARVDVLERLAATALDADDDESTVGNEFTRTPVPQASMTAGAVQLF